MKRFYLFGAIAAMAGGLVLAGSANAAPQKANGVLPHGTTSITFDGYCDGMTIMIPGSAGAPGAQGAHTGTCEGGDVNVYGVAGSKGVEFVDRNEPEGNFNNIVWIINANHTWRLYGGPDNCGVSECLLNLGTWSSGTPAAPQKAGVQPSNSRPAGLFGGQQAGFAGAQQHPGPKVTGFNINFVGYCDGEHLNTPGSAGSPGADGMQTGCLSNPLYGAFEGGVAGMWDLADNLLYVVNEDRTFIIYTDCGDGTECFFLSGNWAFGVPAAPQQNRTVTPTNLRH